MIRVTNLSKYFPSDSGPIQVLDNASLYVEKGEIIALLGQSGAGKTTLLQIMGGIDNYQAGKVEIEGKEIGSMKPAELAQFRGKHIGFVFQFHHLLPDFTALENVIISGMIIGKKKEQCLDRAKALLATMGLQNRFSHFPAELSGGERQRVALARALFNQPALVLADEPTGNLDSYNSNHLLDLISKANKELKQTFLIATHNEQLANRMGRKITIEDGKIN